MLWRMAWRNIWRNRNRSLITMASIVSAVLLATVTASLQKGVYENLINSVVGLYSGYVQVHAKGYWEEQSLENSFELSDSVMQAVRATPEVVSAAPRLETFALASTGEKTKGCLCVGIDPEAEHAVTNLKDKLVQGQFLQRESSGILIAEGLAGKFALHLGDTLILLSQGYYGSTAAAQYPIIGILHFGSPDLNERVVYLPLREAQSWLDAPERATALAMAISSPAETGAVAKALRTKLSGEYEVMRWQDMMADFVLMMEADIGSLYIFLAVLYLLISFGIFSTLLMMLAERQREFGMLVALGMRKGKIAGMVLLESVFLTVSGALLGLVLSLPVAVYFAWHPMRFGGEIAEIYERFGFEAIFPASLAPSIFIVQTLSVLGIGLVLGFYPAWRVLKLQPVQAMRK